MGQWYQRRSTMGKSRKTMGISRDSFHKRRKTGGKLTPWRKKRKFELGRPPSMTKIGGTRIHTVRVRGGRMKYRALRLDSGNFAWPTESVTKRTHSRTRDGGSVHQGPSPGQGFIPPRTVRPLRRIHHRGCRAQVLRRQDGQEEGCQISNQIISSVFLDNKTLTQMQKKKKTQKKKKKKKKKKKSTLR